MKKTFSLSSPRHKPERVLEAIKHDVRKYLKRERRRELPEGTDYWDFDCQVGVDEDSAKTVHVGDLIKAIDAAAAATEAGSIYVEVLRKETVRTRNAVAETDGTEAAEDGEVAEAAEASEDADASEAAEE